MRLALVSDDLHFLRHLLPAWEQEFDLLLLNPAKPPPRIRGPRDLLAAMRNRRLRSRELPPLAEWADVVFCEWATHYLEWLSHHPGRAKLATRLHRYELERHASRVNWENVALVLFVSEAMERSFRAAVPAYGGRTAVVYENLDFAQFSPRERGTTHRLGMLGQVIPRKGVREAVEFFASVAAELPQLEFSIAGKAPDARYRRRVEEAIAAAGLGERVTLEGYVPDLPAWYRSLDVIVSSSRAEGLQTSLVEGVASGCWPLSRDWAGAEEVVPPDALFSSAAEFRQRLTKFYAHDEAARHRQATDWRETLLERLVARPRMAELLAGLAP